MFNFSQTCYGGNLCQWNFLMPLNHVDLIVLSIFYLNISPWFFSKYWMWGFWESFGIEGEKSGHDDIVLTLRWALILSYKNISSTY